MDDEKDILKGFFKERLKDYESPVRRDLWSSLENHVPGRPSIRKRIYITVAAVAAVLLLGLLIYPLLIPETDTTTEAPAYFAEEQQQSTKGNTPEQTTDTVQEKVAVLRSSSKTSRQTVIIPSTKEVTPETIEKEETPSVEEGNKMEDKATEKKEYQTIEQKQTNRNRYTIPERKKAKAPFLQLAVAGNGLLAMNSNLDQTDIQNSAQLRSYSNQMNIGYSNQQAPTEDRLTHINYHLPVTVSLFVKKHLSPRWAIESGISYTRLSSEETWESVEPKDISTNKMKLHYLGIPLKASYLLFNKSRFSVYLSGGAMAEKCISGKVSSTFISTGLQLSSDLDVSQWQFSLLGNLGIDFEIVKPVSLFVEPGVVYYFDDGSEIMTIRKDKPFNFNIQGGLRFSF